jgi:hypothetical protein
MQSQINVELKIAKYPVRICFQVPDHRDEYVAFSTTDIVLGGGEGSQTPLFSVIAGLVCQHLLFLLGRMEEWKDLSHLGFPVPLHTTELTSGRREEVGPQGEAWTK